MGKTLTLDALREQIEANYGPLVIDMGPGDGPASVRLLPVLRLPRERRQRVAELSRNIGGDGDEGDTDVNALVDTLAALIRAVCETDQQADAILGALGDDGQALKTLWGEYQQVTGLGEASASES